MNSWVTGKLAAAWRAHRALDPRDSRTDDEVLREAARHWLDRLDDGEAPLDFEGQGERLARILDPTDRTDTTRIVVFAFVADTTEDANEAVETLFNLTDNITEAWYPRAIGHDACEVRGEPLVWVSFECVAGAAARLADAKELALEVKAEPVNHDDDVRLCTACGSPDVREVVRVRPISSREWAGDREVTYVDYCCEDCGHTDRDEEGGV